MVRNFEVIDDHVTCSSYEWKKCVSFLGRSFKNQCEIVYEYPLSCLDGGSKSQEGAPISLGPQVTMIPTCNRQAGQQEADLSCFNHRDAETVLLKQNLSHLSSPHSASSLGFFFTPITFVNSDWVVFQWVSHILLLIPPILISLPSHPSDDLFFFKSSQVSAVCLPPPSTQTLALASHALLLVLTSHRNPASGNSPERGEDSLEQLPTSFPHLIPHTPPPFLSLISEVIYFPKDRDRSICLALKFTFVTKSFLFLVSCPHS